MRASTEGGSSTCASSASATPTAKRSTREIVRHSGAVGDRRHDERATCGSCVSRARRSASRSCWRSRRGGSTVAGEEPLEAAQRELAEEIGRGAQRWEPIVTYYTSAGFTDERVHLFAATELYRGERRQRGEGADRDGALAAGESWTQAIAECRDAKTLIGLLWLAAAT